MEWMNLEICIGFLYKEIVVVCTTTKIAHLYGTTEGQ